MLKSQISLQRLISAGLILIVGLGLALVFGEQNSRALNVLPEGRVVQISGLPDGQALVAAVDANTTAGTTALYSSRDGGQSWLATGTLPLSSVQALALSPANSDLLAAASSNQVLLSQDGGQTWRDLAVDFGTLNAANARIETLAIDGQDSAHLWVGTTQGLFELDGQTLVRSTDDELGSTAITALLTPSGRFDHLFAATARGLYANTGRGWERINPVAAPVSHLLESSGTLIAATGSNGLYRSVDAGRTWTAVRDQLGAEAGVSVDVTAMVSDPTRPGVLYAATGYWLGSSERHFTPGAVYVSLDHGSRWQPMVDAEGQILTVPARVNRLLPSTTQPLHVQALTDRGMVEAQYSSVADQLTGLESADPAVRSWSAVALGWLGDRSAVPVLLTHLNDRDAAAGMAVVQALGRLGDTRIVPDLIDVVQAPDQAVAGVPGTVRMRAAMVLGLLRADEAVTPLAEVLRTDDTVARGAAADALAQIGTPAAAAALAQPLADEDMSSARQAAMRGLEQLGAAAVPTLEQIVRTDGSSAARRNAAEMLGWIAAPGGTSALVAAMADSSADVRVEAAWALGEIGSSAAMETLQTAARSDADATVRAAATLALSRNPEPAVLTPASADQASQWSQLWQLLAPPRGLILVVSMLLAALVLWLRPGATLAGHRVRHH